MPPHLAVVLFSFAAMYALAVAYRLGWGQGYRDAADEATRALEEMSEQFEAWTDPDLTEE